MKKKKIVPVTLSMGLLISTIAPTVGFAQEDVTTISAETEDIDVTFSNSLQEVEVSSGNAEERVFINPHLEPFESDDRQIMSTVNAGTVATMEALAPVFLKAHQDMATTLTFNYTGNMASFNNDFLKMREEVFLTPGNDYVHGVTYGYSYKILGTTVTMTLKYMSTPEQEEKVDKRIKEIVADIIKPGMTEVEKVKVINDYILINTTYSKKTKASKHSLYALLFEGKGVCQAYALAAYRLLTEAGMEARYVFGYAGESHTWNLVKVDGEWYKLDTTWNDPLGDTDYNVNSYKHLLITSAQLKESHKWDEDKYPKATSTKFGYFRDARYPVTTTGDTVYYSNAADNNKLYKMDYKTGNKVKVSDTRAVYLTHYNNVIYFADYSNNAYLSSYNIETGEMKVLENAQVKNLYIKDYELHYKKGSKNLVYDLPLTEKDEMIHGVAKAFNGLDPKSKTYLESIVNARKYYDLLPEELKTTISSEKYEQLTAAEAATTKAQAVFKDIQAIETSKDVATVEVARKSYNELPKTDRKLISNYKALTAAEKSMKTAVQAVAAIKEIDPTSKKFLSQVKKARKLYDKAGDLQSDVYNAEDFLIIEKQALVYEQISKLKLSSAKLIEQANKANEAYKQIASGDTSLITNKAALDAALTAIQPAVKVVGTIASIDTANITLAQLTTARDEYNALTKPEKKYVYNVKELTKLEKQVKSAATAVRLIDAVDPSNAKFVAQVTKATKAYAKVKAEQQKLVTNKALLDAYETQAPVFDQIAKLKESSAKLIAEARAAETAYKALATEDTAYITNKEKLDTLIEAIVSAEKVVTQISALSSGSTLADVQAVRAAYNALTKQQQKYVTNVKTLTGYEKTIKE